MMTTKTVRVALVLGRSSFGQGKNASVYGVLSLAGSGSIHDFGQHIMLLSFQDDLPAPVQMALRLFFLSSFRELIIA